MATKPIRVDRNSQIRRIDAAVKAVSIVTGSVLEIPCRSIWCLTSGNPEIILADDYDVNNPTSNSQVFTGMLGGGIYPLSVKVLIDDGGGSYLALY